MKTIGISLILLAAAFSALPAGAQETGETSFTLLGHADDGFYWTLEGSSVKNPTLVVPAGATVTVTVKSVSGFHNLHVDGSDAGEYVDSGQETTYTFIAPASGSVSYWCDPHKSSGMQGTVRVAGSSTENGDGEEKNESPGLGLLGAVLGLAGAALVVSRRRN